MCKEFNAEHVRSTGRESIVRLRWGRTYIHRIFCWFCWYGDRSLILQKGKPQLTNVGCWKWWNIVYIYSTPRASKVHCSINGLENSSSPKYSKVQHLFGIAVGLFSAGVGLFSATVGLRKSPPPTKKSPTPIEKSPPLAKKSPTLIEKSPTWKKSSSNK